MESILSDKLKSFDYYKKKLPLYLQNSYGFAEHFRIWQEVLKDSVVKTADEILQLIDIFDKNYIAYINSLKSDESDTTQMLDFLAELFGQQRKFMHNNQIITLTDEELCLLIKTQIIKNYFSGTREELLNLYKSIGLRVFYLTTGHAKCTVYLAYTSEDIDPDADQYPYMYYSPNIRTMFAIGMLTIESLGITYAYSEIEFGSMLIWDISNWDEGVWAL